MPRPPQPSLGGGGSFGVRSGRWNADRPCSVSPPVLEVRRPNISSDEKEFKDQKNNPGRREDIMCEGLIAVVLSVSTRGLRGEGNHVRRGGRRQCVWRQTGTLGRFR